MLKKLIGTKVEVIEETQTQDQKSIFDEILEEIKKEQQAAETQSEEFSIKEIEIEQIVEQPETPQFKEPVPEYNFYEEVKSTVRSPKKTTTIFSEPEQEQIKEKIDPKKLVLYSEIMKPKYKH